MIRSENFASSNVKSSPACLSISGSLGCDSILPLSVVQNSSDSLMAMSIPPCFSVSNRSTCESANALISSSVFNKATSVREMPLK